MVLLIGGEEARVVEKGSIVIEGEKASVVIGGGEASVVIGEGEASSC